MDFNLLAHTGPVRQNDDSGDKCFLYIHIQLVFFTMRKNWMENVILSIFYWKEEKAASNKRKQDFLCICSDGYLNTGSKHVWRLKFYLSYRQSAWQSRTFTCYIVKYYAVLQVYVTIFWSNRKTEGMFRTSRVKM